MRSPARTENRNVVENPPPALALDPGARPAERRECGWMLPDRATTVPLLWSRIPPRPPLFQFKSSIGGVARESYGTAA